MLRVLSPRANTIRSLNSKHWTEKGEESGRETGEGTRTRREQSLGGGTYYRVPFRPTVDAHTRVSMYACAVQTCIHTLAHTDTYPQPTHPPSIYIYVLFNTLASQSVHWIMGKRTARLS